MDIIFFAAVAIYIFIKLRSQFGKVDEDQRREAIKKFIKEQADTAGQMGKDLSEKELDGKKLQNPANENSQTPDDQILDSLDSKVQKSFSQILTKSNITASYFIDGANMAFEMVMEAFCKGDIKTLESLLEKDIFAKFKKAVDDRNKANKTLNTNIIAINQAIVTAAKMVGSKAEVSVNFVSKQISYVSDGADKITQGSKDEINEVSDVWTFSRDLKNKNPNWKVISTKSK